MKFIFGLAMFVLNTSTYAADINCADVTLPGVYRFQIPNMPKSELNGVLFAIGGSGNSFDVVNVTEVGVGAKGNLLAGKNKSYYRIDSPGIGPDGGKEPYSKLSLDTRYNTCMMVWEQPIAKDKEFTLIVRNENGTLGLGGDHENEKKEAVFFELVTRFEE